jgi:hypothetical protein
MCGCKNIHVFVRAAAALFIESLKSATAVGNQEDINGMEFQSMPMPYLDSILSETGALGKSA